MQSDVHLGMGMGSRRSTRLQEKVKKEKRKKRLCMRGIDSFQYCINEQIVILTIEFLIVFFI